MSLMYAAIRTRIDILKEVTFLATKVSNPTQDDMDKLMKVMHYLNMFPKKAIYFREQDNNDLVIYVDASFNIHEDTSGHTGIVGRLFGNTIFVKSMKQRIVTKSSTESELVGLDEATTYVPWLQGLLGELKVEYNKPIVLFQDNKSTIQMASEGRGTFKRSKHIRNRYFWVKQFVVNGDIKLVYVPSGSMLADVFTKSLTGSKFYDVVSIILNEI